MQAVEELKEAYFYARKTGEVKGLHLTRDFYMKLKADRDIETIAFLAPVFTGEKEIPSIMGFDPEIHNDGEKSFWFDTSPYEMIKPILDF
jgi:hypothetical protein